MKRLSLPNYVRRSGAKFESTERFLENSVIVDSTSKELDATGIPLTHIGDTKFATAKDELHAFIIGDSGCGKTRRLILPAIRLYAKTHRSMVISDPKGELYKNTADALKKNGYKVMVLNFRNPSRGSRWNPLGLIENMYRSGDQEEKDRAVLMLKDIIDIMKKEGESEKDRFWENSASKVLMGIALLIMEYGNKGDLTFENISLTSREIFESIAKEKGRGGRSLFTVQEENGESGSFISFLKTLPKNSPILDNLHAITTVAEDTRNSIIGVFDNMLSVYTNQESLQNLFSASDVDIEDLGKTPTALFFVLPDDSGALYPIATVFVKQIYTTLVNLADNNLHGTLDNRVVFLLDEFANFARIPSVESMLTAARSRGISFVLVCQSMEQLADKDKYGPTGAEILLANCRVWVYMSCRNLPFLQRLEQLIGHYVSPYTGETCPLIDIGELQHFDIGQVLVLNDRCRPVMGYLPDYSKYDFGDGGVFVATDLPEKREYAPRPVFSLSKAMNKALKARIASVPGVKSGEEDPADSLRARIMERIEQRRQAKAQAAGNQGEVPLIDTSFGGLFAHSRRVNELFKAGKLVEAAQYSIDHMDAPGVSKNNLAFLIRRGRIPYTELSAPFSVTVRDLLEDGVAAGEPYSMLNLALHCIATKMYKQAVELLQKFTKVDWSSVLQFWHDELWENMNHDPEGALVCLLAAKRKATNWSEEERASMEAAIKEEYGEFWRSEEIKMLDLPEDESSESGSQIQVVPPESWLGADWLSDDDDDDDDDDVSGSDNTSQSSSVADLKAMLQRKIQQKLQETEDEE